MKYLNLINEISEFTGINYELAMLDVPQVGSSSGLDYPERLGIYFSRSGGWKKGGLTVVELENCQKVSTMEMKEISYEAVQVSVPI